MDDFENKLTELHDRVLNKVFLIRLLPRMNRTAIPNLYLSLSNILMNTAKNFGMQESFKKRSNTLNGADSRK